MIRPLSNVDVSHPVGRSLRDWPRSYALSTAAALAILLGIKLYLVGLLAPATPFWDQWDAEGLKLLDPYMTGHLRFVDLFSSHNEHRIAFTRIATLAMTEIGGTWNNIPEAAFATLLDVAFLAIVAFYFRREMSDRPMLIGLIFLTLLVIPSDLDNVLIGFQSQFFFGMIFSLIALGLLCQRQLETIGWWLGVGAAICAQLSMASGFMAPMAAAVVIAIQAFLFRERSGEDAAKVAILTALVLVMILTIERPDGHETMQAHGTIEFIRALTRTTGWPVPIPFVAPFILNAPLMVLSLSAVASRSRNASTWRVIAFGAWSLISVAAIAYSRGAAPIQPRYVNLLSLAAIANILAIVVLARTANRRWHRRKAAAAVVAWFVVVIGSSVIANARMLPRLIVSDKQAVIDRTLNTQTFIRTDDRTDLDKPTFHIPYPDPDRLAMILRRPAIRGLLPAELGVPDDERRNARQSLTLKGGLELSSSQYQGAIRSLGMLSFTLGMAFFAIAIAMMLADRRRSAVARSTA